MAAIALAAAVPAVATASLSRSRAASIAVRLLRPSRTPGAVLVGLPAPLRPRDYVYSSGIPSSPSKLRTGKGRFGDVLRFREAIHRVGRRAWLFWEDLDPTADYEHPSHLLLLDARSGRVLSRQTLYFAPLVDGRPPAFVSGETSPRYRVYPKARKAARRAAAPPGPPTGPGRGGARPVARPAAGGPFPGSCIVLIGDRHDPLRGGNTKSNFGGDLAAMAALAGQAHLDVYEATNSETLAEEVSRAAAAGCTDVAIFLAGHGLAPAGTKVVDGEEVRFTWPEPAVIVNSDPLADAAHNTELTPAGDPDPVLLPIVTAHDLDAIFKAHPSVHFKLLVDSCFAGRFEEAARGDGNVVAFAGSAGANQQGKRYLDTYTQNGKEVPNTTPNPHHEGSWVNGFTRAFGALLESPSALAPFDGNLEGALDYAAAHAATSGDVAALSGLTTPPSFYRGPGGAGGTPSGPGAPKSTPHAVLTFSPDSPPAQPKAGQTVTFDGSGSTDEGSTITAYEWTFGPPAYGGGSATGLTGGGPSVGATTFTAPGIYPVTLTVTDANGVRSDATVAVKVSGAGKKSSEAFSILCPEHPGVGLATIQIFIPSYAEAPELEKLPAPICPGASQHVVTRRIKGNTEGRMDEWGEERDTYEIEVLFENEKAPGNEKVTFPALTVTWK
jgi:hypothetical protein